MRCFVALALPRAIRDAIADVQTRLTREAPDADVRWVPPTAFHVTLVFLGSVEESRLGEIGRALVATAGRHEPVAIAARRVGAFPTIRRARVVWAGLDPSPALATLASEVAQALVPLGFPREERPFRPHVTLGRVRTPRGLPMLARAIDSVALTSFGDWTADEVVLYHSRLEPTGAVYETLVRVPLSH